VVRKGENLYRIAQRYGTSVDAIVRANRIADVRELQIGQRLWIPNGTAAYAARNGGGGGVRHAANPWGAVDPRGRTSGEPRFIWPVDGKVSSAYGFRNGAHHDGIDIPARRGTPVRAAESGRVIHSGNTLAGYGNTVIIKHVGKFSTVYAHNRRNLVREGDFVERGQVIAEVGDTGRTTAPHLHFEIRRNGSPNNPLHYLP
jgi:murein DD-endopeptidase MepM/ murein hydrolase activator NlpD